jgi:glycosyltransferase involved in cell wall biosynthesis
MKNLKLQATHSGSTLNEVSYFPGARGNLARPTVSIAMATYNGAAFLNDQLQSILEQDLLPDELIVCDDGSKDSTVDILNKFQKHAPFTVKTFENSDNLGYTKNFEKAMTACSGDIIFLSDQDDYWYRNKIQRMVSVMNNHPGVMVVICDMVLADQDLTPMGSTQLGNIESFDRKQDRFVTGCGTAVRSDWLRVALPFPDSGIRHDSWIHRLALAASSRKIINEPLQLYRRHTLNASKWALSDVGGSINMKAVRKHGLVSAERGWLAEIDRNLLIIERLEERRSELVQICLPEKVDCAVRVLSQKNRAIKHRLRITKYPRIIRFVPIALFWALGGYNHFMGWKSAAKDIIRL